MKILYNENGESVCCEENQVESMKSIGYIHTDNPNKNKSIPKKIEVETIDVKEDTEEIIDELPENPEDASIEQIKALKYKKRKNSNSKDIIVD